MEPAPVTSEAIVAFLERLGSRWDSPATLYLIGGGALSLLGNPRQTFDLDYSVDVPSNLLNDFRRVANQVAVELRLDLEEAPIEEFLPLPPDVGERRRFLGRFGNLDAFVFDPYTLALSKIARGFESDLDDVLFMLRSGLIEFAELEQHFLAVLPKAPKFDIDRQEFRQYFEEIRRRAARPPSTSTTP